MDQYWLSIIILVLIIAILFDGVRRMRKAKKDSIKMALKPVDRDIVDEGDDYGSEFPNGGARVSDQQIDADRISKARSKYNFGSDIPAWKDKVANTIAEHTGIGKSEEEKSLEQRQRIEPSLDDSVEADPLLDDVNQQSAYAEEESIQQQELEAEQADDIEWLDDAVSNNASSDQESTVQDKELIEEVEGETVVEQQVQAEELEIETQAKQVKEKAIQEPVQTSLNLEDAVPMLMDSLDESEVVEPEQAKTQENNQESIRPVGVKMDAEPAEIETHSANKPRYESKYADHKEQASLKSSVQTSAPEEVLVIHVRPPKNEYFFGSDLLELILDNGLRFGVMDIFHRHADEDGEGPVLFSMANMVKPGTFDLHTFEEFSTLGLSFFLTLPTETGNNMDAFEEMVKAARNIAEKLSGELYDEQRSVMTGQTIEHYRERIRDFARRQQLEKSKT